MHCQGSPKKQNLYGLSSLSPSIDQYQERLIYFMEFAPVILESSNSTIYRLDCQGEYPAESWYEILVKVK